MARIRRVAERLQVGWLPGNPAMRFRVIETPAGSLSCVWPDHFPARAGSHRIAIMLPYLRIDNPLRRTHAASPEISMRSCARRTVLDEIPAEPLPDTDVVTRRTTGMSSTIWWAMDDTPAIPEVHNAAP